MKELEDVKKNGWNQPYDTRIIVDAEGISPKRSSTRGKLC